MQQTSTKFDAHAKCFHQQHTKHYSNVHSLRQHCQAFKWASMTFVPNQSSVTCICWPGHSSNETLPNWSNCFRPIQSSCRTIKHLCIQQTHCARRQMHGCKRCYQHCTQPSMLIAEIPGSSQSTHLTASRRRVGPSTGSRAKGGGVYSPGNTGTGGRGRGAGGNCIERWGQARGGSNRQGQVVFGAHRRGWGGRWVPTRTGGRERGRKEKGKCWRHLIQLCLIHALQPLPIPVAEPG